MRCSGFCPYNEKFSEGTNFMIDLLQRLVSTQSSLTTDYISKRNTAAAAPDIRPQPSIVAIGNPMSMSPHKPFRTQSREWDHPRCWNPYRPCLSWWSPDALRLSIPNTKKQYRQAISVPRFDDRYSGWVIVYEFWGREFTIYNSYNSVCDSIVVALCPSKLVWLLKGRRAVSQMR